MVAGYELTKQACAKHSDLLSIAACDQDELHEKIADCDVAVPLMSRIDAALLARAAKLKLILQFGVGVEGIDIPAATARGIFVSNIPSSATGNALSCAELAIFLTIALLRKFNQCRDSLANERLGQPCGESLFGKTVLVLGYGGIARELMPRLAPFGVRLKCVRRQAWPAQDLASLAQSGVEQYGTVEDLPRLLGNVDIVIVTASQTPESRGLIDREFLTQCKSGIRIVNVARGGLICREAAWDGLQTGKIAGLGLDVQWQEPIPSDDPFLSHPSVVMTPHIAGVTTLSYSNMAQVIVNQSLKVLHGGMPDVWLNPDMAKA